MAKRVIRGSRRYPRRKLWRDRQEQAFLRAGIRCEVTGEVLAYVEGDRHVGTKIVYKRAVHHILAERWVRKFCKGADPHILENLVVITPALHSKITAAENKLFKADWLGYRTELNRLGVPLEMLDKALKAVCASSPQ